MTRIDRVATRYGTWVATSRFPKRKYIRRLAESNPSDFGKYALENMLGMLFRQFQMDRLRAEIKRLRADNAALRAATHDKSFGQAVAETLAARKDVRDKL